MREKGGWLRQKEIGARERRMVEAERKRWKEGRKEGRMDETERKEKRKDKRKDTV